MEKKSNSFGKFIFFILFIAVIGFGVYYCYDKGYILNNRKEDDKSIKEDNTDKVQNEKYYIFTLTEEEYGPGGLELMLRLNDDGTFAFLEYDVDLLRYTGTYEKVGRRITLNFKKEISETDDVYDSNEPSINFYYDGDILTGSYASEDIKFSETTDKNVIKRFDNKFNFNHKSVGDKNE